MADGRDLDERLAEVGIGGSNKSSAQDVLARLQQQKVSNAVHRLSGLPAAPSRVTRLRYCLFISQYLICYLVLTLLGETALVGRLSDFIYYCSVVGSTLGFGDLSPQTAGGRLFTGLWQIPVSVGLFGALMGRSLRRYKER